MKPRRVLEHSRGAANLSEQADMTNPTCTADDCDRSPIARGLCTKHYQRWKRTGQIADKERLTPEQQYEAQLAAQRRYRERNRERLNADRRALREKNLERERERCRQWHRDHPGVNAANTQAWRARNADHVREKNKQWYAANKEWSAASSAKRRALMRATATEPVNYLRVIAEHGMHCHICGSAIQTRNHLNMDHVYPLARGGSHTYGNIRPSHRWCNQKKSSKLPA